MPDSIQERVERVAWNHETMMRVDRASRIADLAERLLVASASSRDDENFRQSMSIDDAYELAEAVYKAREARIEAALEPPKKNAEDNGA